MQNKMKNTNISHDLSIKSNVHPEQNLEPVQDQNNQSASIEKRTVKSN